MTPHPFTIDEYVRWSDVDKAGIIFYGAYVRFIEIAETELFRAAGMPYGEVFDRFDIWLPRVHLEVDFAYPARLDDALTVAAYFTGIGRTSLRLAFEVMLRDSCRLTASGHEVLVATSQSDLAPRPVPDGLRELLEPFTLERDRARALLGIVES